MNEFLVCGQEDACALASENVEQYSWMETASVSTSSGMWPVAVSADLASRVDLQPIKARHLAYLCSLQFIYFEQLCERGIASVRGRVGGGVSPASSRQIYCIRVSHSFPPSEPGESDLEFGTCCCYLNASLAAGLLLPVLLTYHCSSSSSTSEQK